MKIKSDRSIIFFANSGHLNQNKKLIKTAKRKKKLRHFLKSFFQIIEALKPILSATNVYILVWGTVLPLTIHTIYYTFTYDLQMITAGSTGIK